MDSTAHRLEQIIREETAFRSDVDPPDLDMYEHLMAALEALRVAAQEGAA